MMLETTTRGRSGNGAGTIWPSNSSYSSKTRRRREPKVVYRAENTRCSPPRNVKPGSSPTAYMFENLPMRPTGSGLSGLEYLSIPNGSSGYHNASYGYDPIIHQGSGSQTGSGNSWNPSPSLISYTLSSSDRANSPRIFDGNNAPPSQNGFYIQISNSDQGNPWNGVANGSFSNSELDDMSGLDIPCGSYDDSLGIGSPTTVRTSNSESFVLPVMDSALESPQGGNPLVDLDLSDEYFQIGQSFEPSQSVPDSNSQPYDDNLIFENDGFQVPMDVAMGNMYPSTDSQWSAITPSQVKQSSTSPIDSSMLSNLPWSPQHLQVSQFQLDTNAGKVTFAPPSGTPYDIYKARENYLDTGLSSQVPAKQEPTSPLVDSDSESWVITRSNYTPSQSSPSSHGSPKSHISSPRHHSPPRHHSHVFTTVIPGITKSRISKGRTRNLTEREKKHAREVRDAKACWACHISKTKCSPCSPGSPCEQCTRLVGKRRFCKFTCFNDPLESLHMLLVPTYLNGHLNRTDVEEFVARNTVSWGTRNMLIRMSWGHRRLLEADVVALEIRENAPDIGFHDTTEMAMAADGTEILVRRRSPPLGIPLAAMDDMQDAYSQYIQDIVQNDVYQYVPVAYFPEDSRLMTRLLKIVCDFYSVGLEVDEECDLLRRALEMHVTVSILERTLNLDNESISRVQKQLNQSFPQETTAKCVQKQMKLAFFMGQQKRINDVLKDWGSLMWTIHNTANNDMRWAISFCVFLVLILTTDKIFGQTYYFCETRIQHFGAEPKSERAKCAHLLDMAEKELFDRCKEIFHWKFKTRKGGKEACNPIRDGLDAFRSRPVNRAVKSLTLGLQSVVRDYEPAIRAHCSVRPEYLSGMGKSPYMDLGRLSCIFLDDFLDH